MSGGDSKGLHVRPLSGFSSSFGLWRGRHDKRALYTELLAAHRLQGRWRYQRLGYTLEVQKKDRSTDIAMCSSLEQR